MATNKESVVKYIESMKEERNELCEVNDKLRDSLINTENELAKVKAHAREAELTIENLKRIIEKNGPRLVCPICFTSAAEIKNLNAHFRSKRHGLPGLIEKGNDYCYPCKKITRNLIVHQRYYHPEYFKDAVAKQLQLRESKIENGKPVIEIPKNFYDTMFVASVRNSNGVFQATEYGSSPTEETMSTDRGNYQLFPNFPAFTGPDSLPYDQEFWPL